LRASVPGSADCDSVMMSRTAFSASSASTMNDPYRALSLGISVRSIHLPLT
jgi:hypothetical protein